MDKLSQEGHALVGAPQFPSGPTHSAAADHKGTLGVIGFLGLAASGLASVNE